MATTPTPSSLAKHRAEAEAVETTYHIALALMGAQAYLETLSLWAEVSTVPGVQSATASARFAVRAARLVQVRRRWANELTYSYVRLTRALRTGSTLVFPGYPVAGGSTTPVAAGGAPQGETNAVDPMTFPDHGETARTTVESSPLRVVTGVRVPLDELRKDFEKQVRKFAPVALEKNPKLPDLTPDDGIDDSVTPLEPDGSPVEPWVAGTDSDKAYLEELADLEKLIEAEDKRAQEEAEAILSEIAENQLRIRLERAAAEDKARQEQADIVGRSLASHTERLILNGGRHLETDLIHADPRVKSWARVHYPENDSVPCGFCAMLISRGAVYKSAKAAGGDSAFVDFRAADAYHNRCHCRAVPIYAREDYKTTPRFELNRIMWDLYSDGVMDQNEKGKWGQAPDLKPDAKSNETVREFASFMRQLKREYEELGQPELLAFLRSHVRNAG